MNFRGIKNIDFQNDSISVVLSFNKDLYNRVSSKIWLWVPFWVENLKSWLLPKKIPKNTFFAKFHFECVFLDLANKKSSKQFKFCEIGDFTGLLNKLIFLKITSDFKYSLFHLFSLNGRAFCNNLMKAYITFFLLMLIGDSNLQPIQGTVGSEKSIFQGNTIDIKANVFNSITCKFFSVHDIYYAWISILNSTTCKF